MERQTRWAMMRTLSRAIAPLALAATMGLAGCGQFEIGIERPGALATPTPTSPAASAPAATATATAPITAGTPVARSTPPPTIQATAPPGVTPPGLPAPPVGPTAPDPGAATIGERREQAMIGLTVNGVSGANSVNNLYRPEAGKVYLVLDLTIENAGRDEFNFNVFEVHLYDAQGVSQTPSAISPSPGLLNEQVGRGATIRGNIAYEVPPSAKGLFLSFEPYLGIGGEKVKHQVVIGNAESYPPTSGAAAPPTATPPAVRPTATPPAARPSTRPATTTPAPSPTAGAPSGWGPAPAPLTGGQAYNDPQGRFSFRVPSSWTKTPLQAGEIAFTDAASGAVVGVVLEDLSGTPGATIESYDAAAEGQLKRQFPDYTTISTERITVAGRQAYKRVGRVSVQGLPLQVVSVYFIDGATAHVLSLGCEADSYAAQAPTFDGIIGSYQIGAGAARSPRLASLPHAEKTSLLALARRAAI